MGGGGVEGKTTLQLYRNKVSIRDEEIYCNRLGAVILFQCRTNTLRLKWRQGFVGGAVDCLLWRRQWHILSLSAWCWRG